LYQTRKKWRSRRGRPKLRWCEDVQENGAWVRCRNRSGGSSLRRSKSHPGMWYRCKKRKRKRRILAGENVATIPWTGLERVTAVQSGRFFFFVVMSEMCLVKGRHEIRETSSLGRGAVEFFAIVGSYAA
jgi:hypothetical protein